MCPWLVSLVGVLGWWWLPACLGGSCPWLVWLPGYLEPRVPGWCVLGWCGYLDTLNLVPAGSCPWLVWLPACLEPRALLVRVLVGSDYLHTLNLVSLVRVSWFVPCWFVWFVLVGSGYLEPCVLAGSCGSCWLEVITCIP